MLNWRLINTVYEPCVGDGRILMVAKAHAPHIKCGWSELSKGKDYLTEPLPDVDLVITNPPFSHAQQFIDRARTHSKLALMLLRVNFMGSQARHDWWKKQGVVALFNLSKRPCFFHSCTKCKHTYRPETVPKVCDVESCGGSIKAGTDATEYAWFAMGDSALLAAPAPICWI